MPAASVPFEAASLLLSGTYSWPESSLREGVEHFCVFVTAPLLKFTYVGRLPPWHGDALLPAFGALSIGRWSLEFLVLLLLLRIDPDGAFAGIRTEPRLLQGQGRRRHAAASKLPRIALHRKQDGSVSAFTALWMICNGFPQFHAESIPFRHGRYPGAALLLRRLGSRVCVVC